MGKHFDELETRQPDVRERDLFSALPGLIDHAKSNAPRWGEILKDIDPGSVSSRDALAALPVLRKSDLLGFQAETPPFGGFTTVGTEKMGRVFMSPGPIWEPQGEGDDPWKGARSLFAAGFRPGDVIINSLSYHMTPGGFVFDTGARALGCAVFPAGIGNTDMQVDAIAALRPNGYAGTPDFLKVILDRADESGKDMSSIKRGLVGGAALPGSLRAWFSDRGIPVLQTYATADLGVIAYESEAMEGMIINEDFIVEIVKPGTGELVAEGEVGELVVTTFNKTYPLIRFATGDLSAVLTGASPCGRTNMRIKGWMGRADQRTKIKGMFVDPAQVNEIAQRHSELKKLRLVVTRSNEQDVMTLVAESSETGDAFAEQLGETLQAVCKVRGGVEFANPGSLPNDGKVIADERNYE